MSHADDVTVEKPRASSLTVFHHLLTDMNPFSAGEDQSEIGKWTIWATWAVLLLANGFLAAFFLLFAMVGTVHTGFRSPTMLFTLVGITFLCVVVASWMLVNKGRPGLGLLATFSAMPSVFAVTYVVFQALQ